MPKYRTIRKSRSMDSHSMSMKHHNKHCIDATFNGLGHWCKHLFEELCWMILAKSYGMMDKVSIYKASVKRIICAIEQKIKNIKDSDKIDDLKIMHHNMTILWEHIQVDL